MRYGKIKRDLSFVLSLILTATTVFSLYPAMSVKADTTRIAQVYEVSTKDDFKSKMNNAVDGDVVRLKNDITLSPENSFRIPTGCLVTLDLNGKTIAGTTENGVGENSALLIKNGKFTYFDTINDSSGILILSGVEVEGDFWLGKTQIWIVNNSYIGSLNKESGSVNPGASHLSTDGNIFVNPAPAIIGSGTTWKCGETLQADFDQVSSTYSNIVMLKDDNLTADSTLSTGDITFNLGYYKLSLKGYKLNVDNSIGTNIVESGTIDGDLTMGTNSGEVELSTLDVTGTVSNGNHPLTITSGHYNDITGGSGKVTIKGGYYKGTLSGSNYEISGGHFVNMPDPSGIASGYAIYAEELTENNVTYHYTVSKGTSKETIKYSGGAQELVTPGVVEHGTMMYALGSDDKTVPALEKFSPEIPKGTEPKTYYVWYYAKGDDGYESTTPACIVVQIIEVKADTDIDESLLPQGKETSVDTDREIPIPTGLAKEAQSLSNAEENVELKLVVTPKGEEKATESETLKNDAQMSNSVKSQYKDESAVSVEVLEIDIEKYINNNPNPDKLSQTNEVIEIAIPYDFNGKFDARVVRKHDGETQVFTPLSGRATDDLKDGTFYADTTNNVLYIYSNKFSTYVVAYSTVEGNAQTIVESSGSSSSQVNYPKTVPVYRLYNTKRGAHLLTASKAERDLLLGEKATEGWTDEGIAFETAVTSGIPVYRVFDMKNGIHFYTSDVAARDAYVSSGCRDEGIGWYATANAGRKVYKATNPKNGVILYTISKAETDALASAGFTCGDAEFTVY